MAKEQSREVHIAGRYQTPGRKTVRFANDDMADARTGSYEALGYSIDRSEHGYIIMSTTNEQAEQNRLAAIALHNRQVRPRTPPIPGGEGVKPMVLEDERRLTPDMAPPTLDGL